MEQLDPALFFRANRQYIVAHRAIKEISVWPIGKLALTLAVPTPDRIIISKARVPEFKTWYTQ
jgi:two-component system LytT family response regulator